MELTIISTAGSTLNMGMRCLSSYLTSKGHKVNLVFFPFEQLFEEHHDEERQAKLFKQLLGVCADSAVIGLSLTTIQFDSTVKVSDFLKKETGKLIVWGGIHPTLCPEECIGHCDAVCIGDGEDALLELVEKVEAGEDYSKVRGLWVNDNGVVTKNEVREIKDNLDDYPPMDYAIENKWIIEGDELVPLTSEKQRELFAQTHLTLKNDEPCYTYVTQASRGCPHKCAYCSNALFLEKFKGKGKVLRRRGVQSLMTELKGIRKAYPYVNTVNFYDDTFFSTSDEAIVEFADAYKKEIGLPFFALASPLTLTETKLKALLDAGLGHVQMGVQSGSERVNKEVYNRPVPNSLTLKKMQLLNKYKNRIIPQYDFIVDNPYETDGDKLENVRFLSQIPKPYKVQLFSLVFYPHTVLYERAVEDGTFTEEVGGKKKSLAKFSNLNSMTFYSFMVGFSPYVPGPVYKALAWGPAFRLFNRPAFDWLFKGLTKLAIALNKRFRITKKIIVNK